MGGASSSGQAPDRSSVGDCCAESRHLSWCACGAERWTWCGSRYFAADGDACQATCSSPSASPTSLGYASRDNGSWIVAVCPYVAHWLRNHDDVEGSVDTVRSVYLEAVRRADAEVDAADS